MTVLTGYLVHRIPGLVSSIFKMKCRL